MAALSTTQHYLRPPSPQEANLGKSACSVKHDKIWSQDTVATAFPTANTLESLPGASTWSYDSLPELCATAVSGCQSLESLPTFESELESESETVETLSDGYFVDRRRWGIDAMNQFGYEVTDFVEDVSWTSNSLGNGSICFLRRARCTTSDEQVIVKTLSSNNRPSRMQRQELLNEFRLLRSMQHENIVGTKAFLETRYDSWMILDLDCGSAETVQSCIEHHGALSEQHAKSLFTQLLQGLQHIHRQGIIHADVRPANLLMQNGSRTLKLANFGNARHNGSCNTTSIAEEEEEQFPQPTSTLYKAPELLFRRRSTERADIWAAGLSMYYKTHSSLPFDVREAKVTSNLRLGMLPKAWLKGSLTLLTQSLITQCLTVDALSRPTASNLLMHPALDPSSD